MAEYGSLKTLAGKFIAFYKANLASAVTKGRVRGSSMDRSGSNGKLMQQSLPNGQVAANSNVSGERFALGCALYRHKILQLVF